MPGTTLILVIIALMFLGVSLVVLKASRWK